MAKAISIRARKKSRKPTKSRLNRAQIEIFVASIKRAKNLVDAAWIATEKLPPVVATAIFRDLMIEIGHVAGTADVLLEEAQS